MRTDVILDRKQVKLPHLVPTTGFNKWIVQTGDIVVYRLNNEGCHLVGRVVARIAHAPALESTEQPIKNWLLIIQFSHDLQFCYERWVNPEHITQCYTPTTGQSRMFAFMTGQDFKTYLADTLRTWSESGCCDMARYQEFIATIMESYKEIK